MGNASLRSSSLGYINFFSSSADWLVTIFREKESLGNEFSSNLHDNS